MNNGSLTLDGAEQSGAAKDEWLDTKQAALALGVEPGTLEVWRTTKRYPLPYVKMGRLVKYQRSAINKFIESRTVAV